MAKLVNQTKFSFIGMVTLFLFGVVVSLVDHNFWEWFKSNSPKWNFWAMIFVISFFTGFVAQKSRYIQYVFIRDWTKYKNLTTTIKNSISMYNFLVGFGLFVTLYLGTELSHYYFFGFVILGVLLLLHRQIINGISIIFNEALKSKTEMEPVNVTETISNEPGNK